MAPAFPLEYTGLKESERCSFSQLMGKSREYFKGGNRSGFIPDYRHAVETMGESEGIGSSGRIDTEMTASEGSCAPKRKCIGLNADSYNNFGVPMQALLLSKMSQSERKNLELRLKMELERVRLFQKKVASLGSRLDFLSPSTDNRSCSDGKKMPLLDKFNRSGASNSQGKKRPLGGHNGVHSKKSTSGRFEPKPAVAVSNSNAYLMKQCEALLNRLMQHNFGWVFNSPVDVVKLNIPDYFTVIKHPMDFGTVKKKITSGQYAIPLDFAADVRLTLSNAMTYNPPGNDVHIMAETLSKYFEARWKAIEKKLPITMNVVDAMPSIAAEHPIEVERNSDILPMKKKKITPKESILKSEPVRQMMTDQEKQQLSTELESLLGELPENIIDFLKEHSSTEGQMGEEEIEIDIDALSDETLFQLRKLLDGYLLGKQKNQAKVEPCEMELPNESGFSNSSMQPCKDTDSGSESDAAKASVPVRSTKENMDSGKSLDLNNSSVAVPNGANQESAPSERQVSPEKLYRAALLRNRFADTILKAREKALEKGEKGDPEKLRMEREELERRQREEKARLQAEAKAAEEARRKAEAEAAVEAKRKRELEREAARQALLKMEKTVDINENSQFMEDLEMLTTTNDETLPDFMEETSPSHSQNELGSFKLRGVSNPLEQLGLYMKPDDDDEDEPPQSAPEPVNDVEEGEID
ncbi:hypothetical protein ES332_A09G285200v1 [Gossypium tomentosum]|uniref:Bromo domain-containing protein n=1 Tax=Gossypium tomentosum TaxID=34277 RepID=A0A5D2P8R8_GOSTO|nr:hypothetical protein ES332_A09G285200v1 [Gossypium tomentosum]